MAKTDPDFDWKRAPVQFTERRQYDCANTELPSLLALLKEHNIHIEAVTVLDGGYRVICTLIHVHQLEFPELL